MQYLHAASDSMFALTCKRTTVYTIRSAEGTDLPVNPTTAALCQRIRLPPPRNSFLSRREWLNTDRGRGDAIVPLVLQGTKADLFSWTSLQNRLPQYPLTKAQWHKTQTCARALGQSMQAVNFSLTCKAFEAVRTPSSQTRLTSTVSVLRALAQ